MDVGTLVEGKQQENQPAAARDGSQKEQLAPEAAKTRDGKQVQPDRKKPRNLGEDKRFKLFSGTANPKLAQAIGEHIGVKVGEAKLQRFADGEVYFQLLENVRGIDVFVVQPTCYPVDQHLVELLIMIDALKRASAARITVVVPYYGYARQDRKDRPRVAISAKLIADLLTTAGANRALFVDLHAAQIQGFFNIPVDHLFASFRCWSATSASSGCPISPLFRPMQAAWNAHAFLRRRWLLLWPSLTSAAPT